VSEVLPFRKPEREDPHLAGHALCIGCEALTAYLREGRLHLKCMSCGTEQTEAVFG